MCAVSRSVRTAPQDLQGASAQMLSTVGFAVHNGPLLLFVRLQNYGQSNEYLHRPAPLSYVMALRQKRFARVLRHHNQWFLQSSS
ncbi:MAG: hypothetical protein ACJAXK_000998 [Yoonia sp.]|jgi:hypothetical protein